MDRIRFSAGKAVIVTLFIALLIQGCGSASDKGEYNSSSQTTQTVEGDNPSGGTADEEISQGDTVENGTAQEDTNISKPEPIDYNVVKPNETGRIMVVMFHNFIEEYTNGEKQYTTTFGAFEKLLKELYDSDYRLINMNDYINGEIDVPAGCIPMVFTFDDGTAGQFNLIEKDGKLEANPRSAVGIIEKFNETHPDFGMKGTFYVNLASQTFGNVGTLAQRLEYLTSKGFELGNHTYTHINLKNTKSADKIQEEIGGNQKKMYELIPGYEFKTFSLPFGEPSKDLKQYVITGEYEGIKYDNFAIMKVGAEPAPSPFSINFNPLSTARVRSSGIVPVDQDLEWWLNNMSRERQYISDGNPNIVALPESHAEYIDKEGLGGRELVIY